MPEKYIFSHYGCLDHSCHDYFVKLLFRNFKVAKLPDLKVCIHSFDLLRFDNWTATCSIRVRLGNCLFLHMSEIVLKNCWGLNLHCSHACHKQEILSFLLLGTTQKMFCFFLVYVIWKKDRLQYAEVLREKCLELYLHEVQFCYFS